MSLTTNTVKFIIYIALQVNYLFAVDYLILTNGDLEESANKISDIYSRTIGVWLRRRTWRSHGSPDISN